MSDIVIQVDDLWKKYRLGVLGTGTLRHDFNRWLHRTLGKPDPYAKVVSEGGNLKAAKGSGQKPEIRGEGLEVQAANAQVSDFTSRPSPETHSSPSAYSSSLRDDEMWALREVSFEVKQGEILGIIGQNGAGKSTLLKILSRVTAPTSGEIRVKGRIASLLEVGTGFHPELTGRENIFLNGAILGMTKAEIRKKLDEIVVFAEVEKFLDTPVKRYSSGMYVRLAFAVAAHLEPEILIVDEVLAVGDISFQMKCLGKMGDVARGGRTVLFVSHNMASVKLLCTRGIVLAQGDLGFEGTTSQAVEWYLASISTGKIDGCISDDAPRRHHTGEARFRRMMLSDASGNPTDQLLLGEKVRVRIMLEVLAPIRDAVLEVGIVSSDGIQVSCTSTLDEGQKPFSLGPGQHEIALEMDLFLLPRNYCFSLMTHHFDGIIIDWVENTTPFTVLNVPQGQHSSYKFWPNVRGYVRPVAQWRLPEAAVPCG
jgi:homopolymeric O-antigen transport system ATP-binding protein